MTTTLFLAPVLGLMVWTAVMWFWLYAVRIPAMKAARIHPNKARHAGGEWTTRLPPRVLSVAENYNHLHEQPTVFYALMFYVALATGGDNVSFLMACLYIALRIVHTFVQVFAANVVTRFFAFTACSMTLFALLVRTIYGLL